MTSTSIVHILSMVQETHKHGDVREDPNQYLFPQRKTSSVSPLADLSNAEMSWTEQHSKLYR
jgi:hypothetical protein